VDDI